MLPRLSPLIKVWIKCIIFMTIPFHYVTRYKMTINGMVINAMFFGCRVSGEKNGIFDIRLKLVSTLYPL